MKPLLLFFALSTSVLFADAVLAWSLSTQPFRPLQHCVFNVSAACAEGASCDEPEEDATCAPGEECEEEEPDCD